MWKSLDKVLLCGNHEIRFCYVEIIRKGFVIIIIIITRHFYSTLYNNTITLRALHV
jgi:hypothetical protein